MLETTGGASGGGCITLVEGKDTSVPTASLPRPALNVPYTDEHYHLTVTRVTEASQVTDRDIPTRVRHEFSRRPAFNADSTRALEDSSNGWFRLYQVNAEGTFTFLKTLSLADDQEPNWDVTDPNKLSYFQSHAEGLTISTYDVATDQSVVHRDLGSRVKMLFPNATGMWTAGEGRPSDDGKIWCVEVGHTVQPGGNFVADGLISYDMATDEILGHMSVTESPDHISTSPKGDYCVPSWTLPLGTRAYKTDFSSYTQLQDRTENSDLAITKGGVFCNPATQWFNQKIVAVELAANPKIYNLAHSHGGDAGYFGEATAVASPDLTKVLFTSTWGSADDSKAHDYLIQVPSCALP
ncbi:Hypothetical protein A7982_04400 [Minicystis rosea]|nr:Hypothetical protein A7982_04400 [Minicystis rosea]